MWELIARNKQKSIALFIAMGVCLVALGYVIGVAFFPANGAHYGILTAALIWLTLSVLGYFSGDQILLSVSNAKEITRDLHPQLFNVVEEMKIAASLHVMPKIYIMDEAAPNAFATGRKPERSAIAVTTGLLSRLNRDELQGVIAHEMSHVINRDVLFMTFAGILLGSIVLISDVFLRSGRYSTDSSKRYRSSRSEGNSMQAALLVIALVFAILAPILARLLYFAISRNREYLADASGVRLTRYPEGLARALEKISDSHIPLKSANQVTAPLYIDNPFREKAVRFTGLISTHPPIEKRIQILRKMMHSADLMSYQNAFSSVTGQSKLIPVSALKQDEAVPVKEAGSEPKEMKLKSAKDEKREMGDLVRAANHFAFLTCLCGLKIKVPSNFKKPKIVCPRCLGTLENPFGTS